MNSLSDKKIDELAATYGEEYTPDVEKGLQQLHTRLGSSSKPATVRSLPLGRWLTIAAAVVLLISAAVLLFPGDNAPVYANDGLAPLEITLPDGTVAILQQGGRLSHAAYFNEQERRIELSGQAFFQVKEDSKRPFYVAGGETELRVTGTAFNLRIDDEELEVEVSEGSVELSRKTEKIAVTARKCGLSRRGKSLQLMDAPNLNRHAWRTGTLAFKDASLATVLETMRTNFGLSVAGNEDCDYPVSGNFKTDDPVAILQSVALLGGGALEEIAGGGTLKYRMSGICE